MSAWELTRTFAGPAGEVRWDRLGPDGSGGARPVVLLHGTPWSSYTWRAVARALARGRAVYAWDMPGYGQSEKRDGQDVSLDAQGRTFVHLLDHWRLDEPLVVAHDFGGAVALRAHLLHGAAYRALALVDPVALAPWGSPFFRLVRDNAPVFEQLPAALHTALVRAYIGTTGGPGLHPAVLDALVAPWTDDAGRPAFYRQIAQADQRYTDEIQPHYGGIDLPTLVCWGTDDTWIPVAKAHELAGLVPGARLELFEGAGHLVQEDAPAELTAVLQTFLTEQS